MFPRSLSGGLDPTKRNYFHLFSYALTSYRKGFYELLGLDAMDYQEMLDSTPRVRLQQDAVRSMGHSCLGKAARLIDPNLQ